MTSKELRKLSKNELVDRIIELDSVIEKLQVRVEEMQVVLDNRAVNIEESGSLAEAALRVNGVIEAAQKAADQYLENIKEMNEKTTAHCQLQEEESNAKCRKQEAETQKRCEDLEKSTKWKCESMEKETEDKINARWAEFTQKVDRYLAAHGDLKEMLKSTVEKE